MTHFRTLALFFVVLAALHGAASAQVVPEIQIDLAGEWAPRYNEDQPHRVPGPELGDYTGLPLNDAARLKARTWDASVLSQPERQAQPHPATYSMRGPGPNMRLNKIVNPRTFQLLGYSLTGLFGNADRTIWLDGRPHPHPLAEHTWNGFSTGVFEGGKLKVTTTHIKAGTIQRNGVPTSPYARMTEYFIRNGTRMLHASIVEDPAYLEEPFVRTQNFELAPTQTQARPGPFEVVDELGGREAGWVPSYPLGTLQDGFAKMVGLPYEATQGGRATLYPEYVQRVRSGVAAKTPPVVGARMTPPPLRTPPPPRTDYEALEVREGVYLLAGPGGHVTAHISEDGVTLVDSGPEADAEKLQAAIARLTDRVVTRIINTSVLDDHSGGNAPMSQAGQDPGGNAPGNSGFRIGVAPIIAHEGVMRRMSAPTGQQPARVFAAWPTSTYFNDKKTLFVGDDPIEIYAHRGVTDGDSIVFFRRSDVISAGDLFMTDRYPVIDLDRGGGVQGVLDGLNRIIDLAIPRFNQQGGTLVIPGHGRIGNESDVVEYRDMLTIVRDRVRAMIAQRMTLDQVKAARPTLDYDGVYGAASGPWPTDMFVETLFRDLSR
jgi:glyoxylase-like metal-dependent hydrolase (beta-lactamase superfamily II)